MRHSDGDEGDKDMIEAGVLQAVASPGGLAKATC